MGSKFVEKSTGFLYADHHPDLTCKRVGKKLVQKSDPNSPSLARKCIIMGKIIVQKPDQKSATT